MSQTSSEPAVTIGVLKETAPGEQRVAVVPESVPVLGRAGVRVLAEAGAGAAAWFPDSAYERAGATVTDVALVIGANDVTNPAARLPGNPVSGMPILNVDQATGMFFSDAKAGQAGLAASVKAMLPS